MSTNSKGGLELVGCLVGFIMYVGGPLLTGWVCISVFGWPAWLSIILALTVGGLVSHILIGAIVLPILGISSLMESRRHQDTDGEGPQS